MEQNMEHEMDSKGIQCGGGRRDRSAYLLSRSGCVNLAYVRLLGPERAAPRFQTSCSFLLMLFPVPMMRTRGYIPWPNTNAKTLTIMIYIFWTRHLREVWQKVSKLGALSGYRVFNFHHSPSEKGD